jgi:hypothetical protein
MRCHYVDPLYSHLYVTDEDQNEGWNGKGNKLKVDEGLEGIFEAKLKKVVNYRINNLGNMIVCSKQIPRAENKATEDGEF